ELTRKATGLREIPMTAGLPVETVRSSPFVGKLARILKPISGVEGAAIEGSDSAQEPCKASARHTSACALRTRSAFSRLSRAVLLASTLAIASCGGGDGDDDGDSTQGGNQTPSPGEQDNRAPVISGTPPSQAMVGVPFSFQPKASDPDGDILTYEIDNLPVWASFDKSTGRLTGTPTDAHLGGYESIRITVTDGEATAALAPFSIDVVATASGSATLTWAAPSENTDGTPANIAGYKIYYGTASRDYREPIEVGASSLIYTVDQLTPGTWYFAVTAVSADGA